MKGQRDIAARFATDTSGHNMAVLHDDGLYRHLRFRSPDSGMYWFDLITVPGALIFRGDGTSYVFSRIEDMFAFFRGPGRINPGYWSEKLTCRLQGQVKVYDDRLLQAQVDELVAEAVAHDTAGADTEEDCRLAGLPDAVRERITEQLIGDESLDREVVEQFRYWADPADEFAPGKAPDFEFYDVWEWDLRDYDWWFLWACHAIVWGIACYDAGAVVPRPASKPEVATPTAAPAVARRVETVAAAGGVL